MDEHGNHEQGDERNTWTDLGPSPPASILPRGTCVGRFVLLERLGAGAMGVVYRAFDPELDRKIAIKLVHLADAKGESKHPRRELFYREAQALAQLSHPNVIAVYDIGQFSDQVFIAMELVDGNTLSAWRKEQHRSMEEVLEVYIAAGRGLAAAHGAGLVHRDFKPDNVIVGSDGRVRVVDFGLAKAAVLQRENARGLRKSEQSGERDMPSESEPAATFTIWASSEADAKDDPNSAAARGAHSGSRLGAQLTHVGTLVGTPRYMAPEQEALAAADERTDQFAFCVALHESLYGSHPHGEKRRGGKERWRVQPAPQDTRVPPWLREVLLRGLTVDPARRFPTMEVLLRALLSDPTAAVRRKTAARRRAVTLAVVGILAGVGMFAAWRAISSREPPCTGAELRLQAVWDTAVKQKARTAFLETAAPYAAPTWARTEETLDAYSGEWVAMYTEACEATRLHGEQSEAMLDLRMLCLARLASDLGALTEVLAAADAPVVERAVQAAHGLTRVRVCAEAAGLRAQMERPKDEATRTSVIAVEAQLARSKALHNTGKYGEGLEVAHRALQTSKKLAFAPLRAESAYWVGRLQEEMGEYETAEQRLHQALQQAERSGDDAMRARVMSRLVYVVGYRRARYHEARRFGAQATAVYQRVGGYERDLSELYANMGTVHFAESKFETAAQFDQKALALRERILGAMHPDVASSLNNHGLLLCDIGACEKALQPLVRALAIRRSVLGEEHPDTAMSLGNLGLVQYKLGDYDRAQKSYEKALAIRQLVLGAEHARVAFTHEGLGVVLLAKGEHKAALRHYRRSSEIRQRALGPNHPDVAYSLDGMGNAFTALGAYDQAESHYRRSLAILERALGKDNADYAMTLANLGGLRRAQGKLASALRYYRAALEVLELELGSDHPGVAEIRFELGLVYEAQGAHQSAAREFESTLSTCEQKTCLAPLLAQSKFALARVLLAEAGEAKRARNLAKDARAALAQLQWVAHEIAAIDAWLDRHGP